MNTNTNAVYGHTTWNAKSGKVEIMLGATTHHEIAEFLTPHATTAHWLNGSRWVYVYCHQSEQNGQSWYAFESAEERELFLEMIECEGVGPAIALKILTKTKTDDILSAIARGQSEFIKALPGAGPKTGLKLAAHLIREPKDVPAGKKKEPKFEPNPDLLTGLRGLGYPAARAMEVCEIVQKDNPDADIHTLMLKALQHTASVK